MVRSLRLQPLVVLAIALATDRIVVCSGQGDVAAVPDCPDKCQCERRETGLVVRCMLAGLTQVPDVPRETTSLDLRLNQISELLPKAFQGLGRLHTLLLNGNQLRNLSAEAFTGLRKLKYLYLYKNEIDFIDPQAFSGLPALELLYLHNNHLASLSRGLFQDLPNLKRLRLDGNRLICDCNLLWLRDFAEAAANAVTGSTSDRTPALTVTARCTEPVHIAGMDLTAAPRNQFSCVQPTRAPRSQPTTRAPPPSAIVQPHPLYLKCLLAGGTFSHPTSPRILWYHNNQEVVTNEIEPSSKFSLMSDGTLVVSGPLPANDDEFSCMLQSPETGQVLNGMTQAVVDTGRPAKKPLFSTTPKDSIRPIGSSVLFDCAVSGSQSAAAISWTKDGYVVENTRFSSVLHNGSLYINQLTKESSGLYQCIADGGNNQVSQASAKLVVKDGPYFIEEPHNTSVLQDDTLYLRCEIGASGGAVIQWRHNGTAIVESSRHALLNQGSVLRVMPATIQDAGWYTCQATVARQTIKSKPAIVQVLLKEAPVFTLRQNPSSMDVEVGDDVELLCAAAGQPAPIMSWWRGDRVIDFAATEGRVTMTPEGHLIIRRLTLSDAGAYVCRAENSVGVARTAVFLRFTNHRDYAGEKFVKDAARDARTDVDNAISRTAKTLFNRTRPMSSSDLMALFKYPSDAALPIASAAEIFERTLELILKRVQESPGVDVNGANRSEVSIRNILSPEHIRIIAELSGCDANKPLSVDCSDECFHTKYRTIDGTCNNLEHPSWGASLTRLNRFMPPYYENNFNLPIGWNPSKLYYGFPKPSARLVSTTVIGAQKITYDSVYTHMLMQWGQFLDHDLDLSPQAISNARFADGRECNSTCENQSPCFPIMTPPGDPRIQHHRCLGVTRSSAVCGTGETSVFYGYPTHREQLNELTAYIDASQVYGSTPALARHLRDLAGDAGLLRVGLTLSPSKPLLPFNINAKMDCHVDPNLAHIPCFLAGEIRANEQLGLLSMHTIFVREHNRLAADLGRMNRHWDGETVYQEARKILGAVMQHITFEHWLPKAVGPAGMRMLGPYGGYDPSVEAAIMNEFSTAAFRFGHTLIDPIMRRFDAEMREIEAGHLLLHRAFFAPFRLIEEGGVDPVLRGLFSFPGKLPTPDNVMNREVTEKLFKLAHALAQDLASLNVQRGRDHGLPPYNDIREKCGLGRAKTFEDLAREITNVDVRRKLAELYGHPGNIDLFVGAAVEKMVEGSRMGPTFMCIIVEQFRRLRSGDRFFYENPGVFSPEQLAEIKKTSLSRILCDNGDNITLVPPDAFRLVDFPTGYVRCDSSTALPGINLRVWSECCEGCRKNNVGASNAAAASARRRRRSSAEPHSQLGVAADAVLPDDMEIRIEGLEDSIAMYKTAVDQLVKKLEKLEEIAGSQRMNNELDAARAG